MHQRGKIYKIISPHTDMIYIGSTAEPTLAKRFAKHRSSCKAWKEGKGSYISSFKLLEQDGCSIVLLESYPCDSKDQLRAREQHHINENRDKCVNIMTAYQPLDRTKFTGGYWGNYYEKNQEVMRARMRAWGHQKTTCTECGKEYAKASRTHHVKTRFHQESLNNQV